MRLFSLNKIVFAVALISFSISVTAKDLATSSKSVDENSILESLSALDENKANTPLQEEMDETSRKLHTYDREVAQEKAIETKDYKIAITDEQKEALQEFNEENSRNRGHEKLAVKTQKKSKVAVPSDKLEGALMSSFNKPKKKTKVAVKHQDKNKNGKRDNTQYKNRASSLSDTFSK
ncbi:MAG: hypothetical protein IJ505_04150 [Succinivibrio sp.]|nr:hypothetical protein [Succinivibrio sp.]MBQ8477664.1 hypothetical protein [Succinivibrio sp.]MCI5576342.1 hypothetical protein [Succinivibrio sp.]MCI5638061.1 hypothetical protein [Succinivibrio sp.]MCI7784779.1 hypothetical protein [Succinivibrio sp.]